MSNISSEMKVEMQEFFASSAGSVILQEIASAIHGANSLTGALNNARTAVNPEVEVALMAGRVEGLNQALSIIENMMEGE